MKFITTLLLVTLFATSSMANDCEIELVGSDMMKYDVTEITLNTSCEKTKINLTHAGKLPISAMGHNIVIVEESNFYKIAEQINFSHGAEKGYLPDSNEILSISNMVGGGETTTLEIDISKFSKDKKYVFFCSFPGHWALMKGKITII